MKRSPLSKAIAAAYRQPKPRKEIPVLTTDESHATIAYLSSQLRQAAVREAQLVGLVQERDKLLGEVGPQLKAAMEQIQTFQGTIVKQQATIEAKTADLEGVAKYNGMTVPQMLAEIYPAPEPGSRIGGDSPAAPPAPEPAVVDSEGGEAH